MDLTTVRKCIGRSRILVQDKAIWGNSCYGKQNENKIKIKRCLKLEFSWGQVSCPRVWGCPRNLTSREFSQQKIVAMLATMSFFSLMLEGPRWGSLGHSVNPSWWRTHFVTNQIASFPWNFSTCALLHCNLKRALKCVYRRFIYSWSDTK